MNLATRLYSGRSCFLCLSVSGHYSQVVLCAENLMMDSKSFFIIPRVGNRESTKRWMCL